MTIAQTNFLELAKKGNVEAIASLINHQLQPKGITAKVAIKGDCLQVILEAVKVLDQEVLVTSITRGLVSLAVESVKTVKIYGKQIGEDFPDWQADIEMPLKKDIIELANEGDIPSINTLIHQWLSSQKVIVKSTLKNGSLQVMLESAQVPDQQESTLEIQSGILNSKIEYFKKIKVYGRELGDEFPAWNQELDLAETLITVPSMEIAEESQLLSIEVTDQAMSLEQSDQISMLALAKQGDSQAMTQVLNYLLKSKGIITSVHLKNNILQIILQSQQTPEQEQSISYVRKFLEQLPIESSTKIIVYGRRKGATFHAWTQYLTPENSIKPEPTVWGALWKTVTDVTDVVGSAASQTGGAIAGAAVGTAQAVGSAALQATDGVGYVVHMISDSPQLQELTKAVQVDWLLAIIDRVDVVKAESRVKQLQRKYPSEKPGEIAHRVMLEKALYVGGSGFASSLVPGFAAPMFAVDLAATTAIQAEMGYQIACAYGLNLNDPARKGEILGIFGLALGGRYAIKAGLGLIRNIPLAGAAIGASSNAAMLYAVGHAACHFYEAKINPLASATAAATSQADSEAFMKDALRQQVVMDQILVHVILAGHPGKTWEQVLPELPKLNLSPTSMEVISTNIKAPPSLEALLNLLNHDFAIPLVAQCHSIAQMDGVTTLEEAKVLKIIADRFSVDIASLQSQGAIAPPIATGALKQKLFGLF